MKAWHGNRRAVAAAGLAGALAALAGVAARAQFSPVPEPAAPAAVGTGAVAAPVAGTNSATIVTADRLDADLLNRTAVFRGNVTVRDAAFQMRSDEMTVSFNNGQNGVDSIHAKGRVVITQQDKSASADEAIYVIREEKIVLNGSPKVQQGANTLTGASITFYRNENRVQVDGRTILLIQNPGALGTFTPKPQAPSPPQVPAAPGGPGVGAP